MSEIAEGAVQILVSDMCKRILNAISQNDHPLSRCTSDVKKKLREGGEHGARGEYQEAIQCFRAAAELDPKYIGTQLRMVKVYKQTGHRAKALFAGGAAIQMTNDPEIRCQLLDLMGQVAKEIFVETPTIEHLDDAISFYHDAIRENEEDLLPRWNLLCAYLDGWRCTSIDERMRRDWYERAKGSCTEVVAFTGNNRGESREFIHQIVTDAQQKFPEQEWWKAQLQTLEEIANRVEWINLAEVKDVNADFSLKKALALCILSLALLLGGGEAAAGTGDLASPPAVVQSVAQSQPDALVPPLESMKLRTQLPYFRVFDVKQNDGKKAFDFVEIERDWKKLAEIERPWEVLS